MNSKKIFLSLMLVFALGFGFIYFGFIYIEGLFNKQDNLPEEGSSQKQLVKTSEKDKPQVISTKPDPLEEIVNFKLVIV